MEKDYHILKVEEEWVMFHNETHHPIYSHESLKQVEEWTEKNYRKE